LAIAPLPFIDIKPEHDLEATVAYLSERNNWIESAKHVVRSKRDAEFLPVNQREIKI